MTLLELLPYASIPITSAVVGWFTNVVALKMTFYPLDFVGKPPYLGWQGIIPSKAGKMADKAVDLITNRLITVEEVFGRLDPERVAEEMGPVVNELLEEVIDDVMTEQSPTAWRALPQPVRKRITDRAKQDARVVIVNTIGDLRANIRDVFDLKKMVIDALLRDKALLNEIFLRAGEKEFRFIEHSGFYFGFFFGILQMAAWFFYKGAWVLPVAGFAVGYLTNWLALKLIFEPVQPRRVGPWEVQGLFLKRQHEVAAEYSQLIANEVVNSSNILQALFSGSTREKLFAIIEKNVMESFDEFTGSRKKFVELAIGQDTYKSARVKMAERIASRSHVPVRQAVPYAEEAFDIENSLRGKMQALKPDEFVGLLRPVFQEDEWKLILVGGVLGVLVGIGQWVWVFS